MALATANGTERNRLVRDQLFPVDFYTFLIHEAASELKGDVGAKLPRFSAPVRSLACIDSRCNYFALLLRHGK